MKDSDKLDDGLVILSSVGNSNSGLIVPGHTE